MLGFCVALCLGADSSVAAKLHFYSKGILRSGVVYLATATSTEDQWAAVSDNFKGCVDSFQLDAPGGGQP
jgi:hypothetical protein